MNRVYLNTSTGRLDLFRSGPAVERFDAKLGSDFALEVIPDVDLPADATGYFSAKASYGGALLAHATWSAPAVAGDGWLFSVSMRSAGLAALFTAQLPSVPLVAEITVQFDGKERKSQTVALTVARQVFSGTEDTPPEVQGTTRIGSTGHLEYTFDNGDTWWRWAPALVDGRPEFQWFGPLSE